MTRAQLTPGAQDDIRDLRDAQFELDRDECAHPIGAASVDNPASPEDLALALDRLDVLVQNLQGRGILYLADVDTTPSSIAHEVANALALSLQPDFGDNTPPGSGALPSQRRHRRQSAAHNGRSRLLRPAASDLFLMVDIPFPRSSQPGSQPGEGLGRLVNRYCEVDGEVVQWKLVPGLVAFTDTLLGGPRGMIDVNGTLYDARAATAVTLTSTGGVTVLARARAAPARFP